MTASSTEPKPSTHELTREQRMSALFAGLILNQSQLALMFLGKVPHPHSGQTEKNLEGARLFIDQLEMLEEKTKGNLDSDERKLLRDHLTALRMAFVEASAEPATASAKAPTGASPTATSDAGGGSTDSVSMRGASAAVDAESRKKFSKKY